MTENLSGQTRASTPRWSSFDTIVICAMLAAALFTHFWRIGVPDMLVYDEHIYVEEAYKYLRGETFFEVHPPFAILLIVAGARIFGCRAWSWRVANAVIGAALIPITYFLARRMFNSRGAAMLAALLVLCEGMFLQYSRLALINIVYLTMGAAAYLALFRFIQTRDPIDHRRTLVWMGIVLGLGLGSKFAIPGITWLLVVSFLAYSILVPANPTESGDGYGASRASYLVGAIALLGGISGIVFFLTFLPNYALGWWNGISSLTTYYHRVLLANRFYPPPLNHQDSPWWKWPLMLRAYKLWQAPDDMGMYLTTWGGGNPAIWWAALVAFVLGGIRAVRGGGLSWIFLTIGYLAYLGMFIPVHRSVYLYSYMPALYLGIIAMAGLLDECWKETAPGWEQAPLLLPVFAVSLLGLGYLSGSIVTGSTVAGFSALTWIGKWRGKFVCMVFLAASIAVFFYFLPLWIPQPMTTDAIDARMWFSNAGLGNWK